MTPEQIVHYHKGGKFKAIYSPTVTHDLSTANRQRIGDKAIIVQNMINSPMITGRYKGQHMFNTDIINGYCPEEDFKEIEIIDEFLDTSYPLPVYMYRLTYTEKGQLKPNFGKDTFSLPLEVGREYVREVDEYILNLSSPQATTIEKAIYDGSTETLEWKVIFPQ